MNKVNLRRARLVLRWATVSGFSSWCRTFITVSNQPSLSSTLSSRLPRRILCASLWSSWSPASAICQTSSTVSSTSLTWHLWDPCFFCNWTNSLEFTAWLSEGSSCGTSHYITTSHPRPTQPSIPLGSVNEYQLWLGRQGQVWFIPLVDERGVCR